MKIKLFLLLNDNILRLVKQRLEYSQDRLR
jgi:hypothetical protein